MSSEFAFLGALAPHPPAPPAPSTSRAGRNLWQAIPTALLLLGLVAASVAWHIELFVAVILVALLIAMWEAAGAFLAKNIAIPLIPLLIGTTAMVGATWLWGLPVGFAVYGGTALFLVLWRLVIDRARPKKEIAVGLFALTWISVLGIFAVALTGRDHGAWLVALLILVPVGSDTGGWLAGVLFGKHPMVPKISPKKSWEGFAGSIALAIFAAWLVLGLGLHFPWWTWIVYGVAGVFAGTFGDLCESFVKRSVGVKDMGSLFPGHGGMLDRIDSIMMWAPVCYVLSIFVLGF